MAKPPKDSPKRLNATARKRKALRNLVRLNASAPLMAQVRRLVG